MSYGAPRVLYKQSNVKPAPKAPVVEPIVELEVESEVIEPIEEDTNPETANDQTVLIPTTFVKKTEATDVNQYVRKRK